jgi:hypothetical protein
LKGLSAAADLLPVEGGGGMEHNFFYTIYFLHRRSYENGLHCLPLFFGGF